MSDTEQRLKEFAAFKEKHATRVPLPADTVPLGLEKGGVDEVQRVIDEYNKEVPDLEIDTRFEKLPLVTDSLQVVTTDFPDKKRLSDQALILIRWEQQELVELGRKIIPMISSGFSQKGVGSVFILAYHLQDPSDGSYIFPDDAPSDKDDKPLEDLADNIMHTRTSMEMLPNTEHPEHEARAYAYIAASLLRLFTKSEENYIRAFNHISLGFQRFYGYPIPINLPQPTVEAIRTLSHYFSHGPIFKSTLYRILYMGGGMAKAEGMRKFLYEIHLANTGMHVVGIFIRLCSVLNCSPGLLMTVINSREHIRQTDALVTMIELIARRDEDHERRMWRYGRIFDETFMTPLQTKTCPQLVYILASALKDESTKSNQDILSIAQLGDLNAERRTKLAAIGKMIVKMIRKHHAKTNTSPAMRLLYL